MEADVVEAEAVEKPPLTKKSDTAISSIVAVGVTSILLFVLLEELSSSRVYSGAKIKAAQNQIAEFETSLRNYQLLCGPSDFR